MSRTAEYDAFGPWIYEVRSEEDVPRLFRSYPLDLADAVLTIKVPREIERRDANPAMDLYDVLLSLGAEKVTVLRRRGREYDFREFPYEELQGVTELTDLLNGRLVLHAEGGPVVVRFNASSGEIITQLVRLVRGLYTTRAWRGAGADVPPVGRAEIADVERDLQILHRRLRHEQAGERTIAVQPRHPVKPAGPGVVSRAISRAWPTAVQSAVFILGEKELQVLHRGKPFVAGYKPVHALARTILPLERLVGVEMRPNDDHPDVTTLGVRIGHVVHEFVVDDFVAEGIVRQLRTGMIA